MISELLFLVSIVDAPVVAHRVSPQRADTLCQHQRRGTMQSSTSALYSPSQDFLDGFSVPWHQKKHLHESEACTGTTAEKHA